VSADDERARRRVEIPASLQTIAVPDGFEIGARRTLIKRDSGRLLWALGEIERDLQATLGSPWCLAMRSSLTLIAENGGVGKDAMTTIEPGFDPSTLDAGALEAERLEHTLDTDALQAVAHAAHWLAAQTATRSAESGTSPRHDKMKGIDEPTLCTDATWRR
jgi:hypothetical protein